MLSRRRFFLSTPVLLTLHILLVHPAVCAADVPAVTANSVFDQARGPVPIRNMRPYNLLFLQFPPDSPDILHSGSQRFNLQFDVANNMLIPAPAGGVSVVEDNEIQRLMVSWSRGAGRNTELGASAAVLWRNGGFLDEVLRWWHRFWGIPTSDDTPAGRDSFPDYRSLLKFTDSNGVDRVSAGNALGISDLSVFFKHGLFQSRRSAISIRAGLKLPTGNPGLLLGSGNVDLGLSVDGRYNVGRDFILYASAGELWLGKASALPSATREMTQYLVALEYRPNRRDSFIWQVDGNTVAVRTGNHFADGAQVTATFGYKRALNDRLILYLAFSENGDYHDYSTPILGNVGPDFTATVGMEWRR